MGIYIEFDYNLLYHKIDIKIKINYLSFSIPIIDLIRYLIMDTINIYFKVLTANTLNMG